MRIITVFTVFVIVFFRAFPAGAQINRDYAFSLCPQTGFFYGHVEEIVYPSNTKAPLLSQLLWDMKPVFYYGVLTEFSPVRPSKKPGFFSTLSLKFGIPGRSGVMEDRDWMSVENTELTNFSSHDNIAKEIFLLDLSAGVSFRFFNAMPVRAFVNISYMSFRFHGENGYAKYARSLGQGKYAPINDDPVEMSFNNRGKVIGYCQEWFFAAPGVSAGYCYGDYFSAELYFTASPLVLCADLDEHILTKTRYRDYMSGGWLLEPGLKVSFAAGRLLGISCGVSWRNISGTRGLSYNSPITGGTYYQEGEAGAGLSILDTALLLKVRL